MLGGKPKASQILVRRFDVKLHAAPQPLINFFFSFKFETVLTLAWNSLCRPEWPGTHRHSASVSKVLEIKVCATMPGRLTLLKSIVHCI